jgi:hypothetical protein
LQRIQIKIQSDAPPGLRLDPFLEIFGRWRMEKEHPAEWVDLADYAHIARGPGVVLIGHQCNLALDVSDPGPGILYAAKKGLSGSSGERITAALRGCLEMSKRLSAEPEFPKGVRLRTDQIEIRFNDRLETPNTPATDAELQPAVREAFNALYGPGAYELIPPSDPKQPYGFSVKAKAAEPLDALLDRLAAG